MQRLSAHQKIISLTIALSILFLQIFPLLWNRPFAIDWINHVWTLSYYTHYLKDHGSFPASVNVIQAFGNPMPNFYGVFFYPLLSLVAIITGPDLAMRIICGVLLIAPMCSFALLFKHLTKDVPLSILLSVIVNSSIYALTNLYSRSALTEFFAFQLLILSISLVAYGLTQKSKIGNAAISIGFACTALSLGSHPITFYTFMLFAGPLLFFMRHSIQKVSNTSQLHQAIFWMMFAILTLLPWILLTIKYYSDLQITAGSLYYFPASIDSLLGKLGFFYFDPRVRAAGSLNSVSTPFLDAPLPLTLFLLLAVIFYRLFSLDKSQLKKIILPSVVAISLIIFCLIPPSNTIQGALPGSVSPMVKNEFLSILLTPIQFIYRLSNTFSLCCIISLISAIAAISRIKKSFLLPSSSVLAIYFLALLSLICTGEKTYTSYLEYLKYPSPTTRNLASNYTQIVTDTNTYPPTFYAQKAYAMFRIHPYSGAASPGSVELNIRGWGQQLPITCFRTCTLDTNIVSSKFIRVSLDGTSPKNIFVSPDGNLKFPVKAGTHILKVDRTDSSLIKYTYFSIWTALIWFLVSLIILSTLVLKNLSINHKTAI
jgi:hypothetical protein